MRNSLLISLFIGLFSCISGNNNLENPPVGLGSEEPFLLATDYGLVLSWMEPMDGDIHLRYSIFNSLEWSEPKTIARGTNWFVNWADFPALIANKDKLFAHFLKMSGDNTFDYDVMYTVSNDQGKTWAAPQKIHSDTVKGEHGFVSGIPYKEGFAVTWLDGRFSKSDNSRMSLRGAIIDSLGYVSKDIELDSMTCDCCQTAMIMGKENPIVFYRDRTSEEIRDIKTVMFSESGVSSPVVFNDDNWEINACPVNGPAVDRQGNTIATAWYTGSKEQYEVKLKISDDAGETFSAPILVDGPTSFGRMDIKISNGSIYLTYLTREEMAGYIMLATYSTNGELISKVKLSSVSPERGTGFPRTAIYQDRLFISWNDIEASQIKLLAIPLVEGSLKSSVL